MHAAKDFRCWISGSTFPSPPCLPCWQRFTRLFGVLIHVVTFRSPLRAASKSLEGIVPQMLAVIGLLFGLLTGFLAADIGDHNAQAARAVGAETNALHEVRTLSIAAASDMADIRQALHEFVRSEIQDEWPRMADIRPICQDRGRIRQSSA